MKKIYGLLFIVCGGIIFTYCSSGKKSTKTVQKVTYEANIAPLLVANCTPCHFPEKGGRKKPLDSYKSVTAQLEEVIKRIQMNPTERGFMPDRKAKLPDTTIAKIKQWQADGLLER